MVGKEFKRTLLQIRGISRSALTFNTNTNTTTMSKNQKPVIPLNTTEGDTASKIEVIKNLIFGENIQAYDSEFELLKKDILGKKKALEQLVDEARSELNTAIDNVATDVNIRITELETNLENKVENLEAAKVNKKILGKLLIELGEKVSHK